MECDRKPGQNGKGDKSRVTNVKAYKEGLERIFGKKKKRKQKNGA